MTTQHQIPAPPIDPESAAALSLQGITPSPITAADIGQKREEDAAAAQEAREQFDSLGLVRQEHQVPTADGHLLALSLIHRKDRIPTSPLIYYLHGGGMMLGTRFSSADVFVDWINRYNAVVATIEYRLAPEHLYPTPQEDCYAGLVWLDDNAGRLEINVEAGLLAGISAGAGLAAALTLMARDRGGPAIGAVLLLAPMLDDRNATISTRQFPTGMWNASENALGWRSLLGDLYGQDDVPPYAAPARADDLSGLPPTFVEVGSAEVFRDEAVAYTSGIWAAGGQAELHVWSGGFHGFQTFTHTSVAQGSVAASKNWMDRTLGFTGRDE